MRRRRQRNSERQAESPVQEWQALEPQRAVLVAEASREQALVLARQVRLEPERARKDR